MLPSSAAGHSWLAAAALLAAPAGGRGRGTARGRRSGTGGRSGWALVDRAAGLAATRDCGDSPYWEAGSSSPGPSRPPEALGPPGEEGEDGSSRSVSAYSGKPEPARS